MQATVGPGVGGCEHRERSRARDPRPERPGRHRCCVVANLAKPDNTCHGPDRAIELHPVGVPRAFRRVRHPLSGRERQHTTLIEHQLQGRGICSATVIDRQPRQKGTQAGGQQLRLL